MGTPRLGTGYCGQSGGIYNRNVPHIPQIILAACLAAGPAEPSTGLQVEVHSPLLKPFEQADIPALESGVLAAIHVQEGARVEAGTVLAQIEDSQARLARTKAEWELAAAQLMADDVRVRAAEKTLAVAQAELNRALGSTREYVGSVSQAELARLRLLAEQAALAVEQAKQDRQVAQINHRLKQTGLEQATKDLARRQIVAPFAGVVTEIHLNRGEWVQPGQKVLRLIRCDTLRAEGFVDAAVLDRPLEKARVRLTVDLPGGRKAEALGSVVYVSPEVDPVNNQVRVWATIDNRQSSFRPGTAATMAILPTTQGAR